MKKYSIINKDIEKGRSGNMKKYFSFFVFHISLFIFAQSLTENYVLSTSYLSGDKSKKIQNIQYMDGLGRPKQSIAVKANPTGKDMVIPIEYDGYGRQTKSYLPVPVTSLNGNIQPTDGNAANSYYGVTNAYSELVPDDSPLNRIMQSAFPGDPWIKNTGNTVHYDYDINTTQDGAIKKFVTSTSWTDKIAYTTFTVSSYPNGELYKFKTTDEDRKVSVIFKNKSGQIVLTRKILNTTENADTYYVYDEYDNLAYIISPLGSVKTSLTATDLDKLCYQYRYDDKNRLAEKKLPGKGWEYMVYDNQDRLVMAQDANLGANNQWLFTKYDMFGRIAYRGLYTSSKPYGSAGRAYEQGQAASKGFNNVARTATGFAQPGVLVYYDNDAAKNYPNIITKLLSVNYYDTYPTDKPNLSTLGFTQSLISDAQTSAVSTKGLPTAAYLSNIENNTWTKNYIYYDDKGRGIAAYSKNHLGGYTKTESFPDFAGVVQKMNTYHKRKSTDTELVIKEEFTYDPQNRLLTHTHEVVGKTPKELLVKNHYNEKGQLDWKEVGGVSGSPLQTVNYAYNIRGWLTGINGSDISATAPYRLDNGKLFGYKIKYNDPENRVMGTGRYNGSIAEVDWIFKNSSLKRYGYQYDNLDRLLRGNYQDPSRTLPESHINDEIITYDLNGNIGTLVRNAKHPISYTPEVVDNLKYTYDGNRVIKIEDNPLGIANPSGYEGGGGAIDYDGNGNMIAMPDKGISAITYNFLDLPTEIDQNDNILQYYYRADGAKLKKVFTLNNDDGTTIINTEYLDGFQYSTPNTEPIRKALEVPDDGTMAVTKAAEEEAFTPDPERKVAETIKVGPGGPVVDDMILSFFPTAEGYYDFENLRYIYQYKDHLGNVRVSYVKNPDNTLKVMDTNEYYPFGMSFLKQAVKTIYDPLAIPYNYKFNNKELQETGMYDFGARNYMPDVGRWFGHDPLAELAPALSPYRYAFNNPVSFTDPDGMYEGDDDYGGGDYYDDSDRGYNDRHFEGNFNIEFYWSGEARSYDDSSDLWDIIRGAWGVDVDIHSGWHDTGDSYDNFEQDMIGENDTNDMIGDSVQDSYPENGPILTFSSGSGASSPFVPGSNTSNTNNYNNNNDQGPGDGKKPTLEDLKNNPPDHPDFKAPKKGNRKVKNPNGGNEKGWLDNKGRVWIPNSNKGNHNPHWDVQPPGGGPHTNVYPIVKPVAIGVGAAAAGYIIYKIAVGIATWECGGCGVLLTP